MTNPPDDARIWHTLDALAYALTVALYDEDSALVIECEGGEMWATSYAEFDDLTALGWVTLIEDLGQTGYTITERGHYWLRRWADRQARHQRKQVTPCPTA